MMKANNISLTILYVALSVLMASCKVSKENHGHDEHEEKHADEIVFTQKQAAEAGLKVEEVNWRDFSGVLKVSGQLQSSIGEEQTVVATANGIVTFTGAKVVEGTGVSAGQSLVTLSAKKLQDGDPAQKARIAYETAEKEYKRAEGLVADKIISVKEFEQVRSRYELAKTAYQAQAGNMTAHGVSVTAPMSGFIKSCYVKSGDYVSVGDPIATITKNRRLQLRAEAPEGDAKFLRNVYSAHFKVAYDDAVTYRLSDLNGKLLSYGKSTDANTFYLPVIFEFDNVGDFVAGSYVEVFLLGKPNRRALTVPMSALTEEQGVYYVYLKVKGHKDAYQKREVEIGQDNGDRIEITKGLMPGDVVVVRGAYQVRLAASSSAIPEGHSH